MGLTKEVDNNGGNRSSVVKLETKDRGICFHWLMFLNLFNQEINQ